MGKYSYHRPVTDKPPSAISALGRIVKSIAADEAVPSREIFRRAFAMHESFDICKTTICTARARNFLEKELWQQKRPNRYRLTQKGLEIKHALERR